MAERRSPEEQIEMVKKMIAEGDVGSIFGVIATETMSTNAGMDALVEGQEQIIKLLQQISNQIRRFDDKFIRKLGPR